MRGAAGDFAADRRALAAVEFAFILKLMLVLFFDAIEFSTGIAVDRKVSLTANTLSNLLSESAGVITIPSPRLVNRTYLILSEVSYR